MVHNINIVGISDPNILALFRENMLLILFTLSISTLYINIGSSAVVDTITSSQLIKDPETISSNDDTFKLGFFSPPNTTNRYVGIWYLNESNIIWVANRGTPLKDSSGVLTISNRNLVLLNRQKHVIWSSNVSTNTTPNSANTTAQLLNTGNLVLLDDSTGKKIWESFKEPSDTFLPNLIISTSQITGEKVKVTSWKTPSDPAIGIFSGSLDRLSAPEVFIWNQTQPYWRSGPWNGQVFISLPNNLLYTSAYLNGFSISREDNGVVDITYTLPNSSFFGTIVVSSEGKLVYTAWINKVKVGQRVFQQSKCDVYGFCGPHGSCDLKNSPICSCLTGFEPRNVSEWNRQNWTSGCVRKALLQCDKVKNESEAGKGDVFLKLQTAKVPDFGQQSYLSIDACKTACLNNCSCSAYAFDDGIGCLIWSGKLVDIVRFSSGGIDLYIRQPYSELAIGIDGQTGTGARKNVNVIIIPTVIVGAIIIAICTYFLWSWISKRSGKTNIENRSAGPIGDVKQVKIEDLPLFDFGNISSATNNFGLANKIGQGGFGSVYKGVLPDGQEIAVKRLSKASGQGIEEFMNEVIVISKLQHRNLVRLLGCCIGNKKRCWSMSTCLTAV